MPKEGEAVSSVGGDLLTSTGDIVIRGKEYFEELPNPVVIPSTKDAEAEDSEVESAISQAKVTKFF